MGKTEEMNINAQTKISALIKAHQGSIEAIASVAKPLEKLRNPILRKIMAGRVNIKEAAAMGGCTVEAIVKALKPLGFVFENNTTASGDDKETNVPGWLQHTPENDIHFMDVRPIIDHGSDPLKAIMAEFKKVPEGEILCIINSFVPTPLIHLLTQNGKAESYTNSKDAKEHYTYFFKSGKKTPPAETATPSGDHKVNMDDGAQFNAVCNRFTEEQRTTIDVRHLEMPQPMETILAALKTLPDHHALYVHHKRVPVYLLEELADKDYEVHIHTISETEVKMLLFKNK